MNIGIVGSRRRTDRQSVIDLVNSLPEDSVVISGGCRGVDTWAKEAALNRGLQYKEFSPQWPKPYNPNMSYFEQCEVFYARNRQIAEASDTIYAFVSSDRKGGTENTIKHAEELGKQVVIL